VRHNEKYFKLKGFGVGKYPWEEATKFRKHFKQVEISDPCIRTGIEEHKLESLFLREMSKKSSENKFSGKLSEIQPVKVAGCPLQMPLPIGGSAGEPKPGHGHIDILARRRIRGTKVLLSVWELKDVNKLAQAVKQAYIYAVTLLLMLKSPSGQKWYKIFGFHGKLPKKLGVEAVVAVSRSEKAKVDKTIKETIHLMPLEIKEGTIDLFACVYDVTEPLDIDFRKIS